jgi:heat shock protein HspQ
MKLYIVFGHDYLEKKILSIFDTEEKALNYIQENKKALKQLVLQIEEFTLNHEIKTEEDREVRRAKVEKIKEQVKHHTQVYKKAIRFYKEWEKVAGKSDIELDILKYSEFLIAWKEWQKLSNATNWIDAEMSYHVGLEEDDNEVTFYVTEQLEIELSIELTEEEYNYIIK